MSSFLDKTLDKTLDKIYDLIVEMLFPVHCYMCKTGKEAICNDCYKLLEEYKINNNNNNRIVNGFNSEVYNLYNYEGEIRHLILGYKFYDKSYLNELFVKLITNDQDAFNFISSYDIIIPVPLHKKRKQDRGYNQTELIAKKLAKFYNKEFENKALLKVKNIKPQTEQKGYSARKENVLNAFRVVDDIEKINRIKHKKILLIDDVYTTGSTYKECKKALIEAGALSTGILTIAKD